MTNILRVLVGLIILVIAMAAWVHIFQKAGYSGWMAILTLIPVINCLALVWFATSEWSIEEELRRRRGVVDSGPDSRRRDVDADALLGEATRLEATGDGLGALSKYQLIFEAYPGTDAACEAEKKLSFLRQKLGVTAD